MALRLWLGPAGSGKSHEMYTHILKEARIHPEIEYLVIVPEQFTLQTQKNLAVLDENHGILNVDVLSFARLAHRITEEVGGESCNAVLLNDMGKNLILRRVAAEHEEELTVFANKLKRLGYITEVKSLISEFMQYGISVHDTRKLSEYAGSMGRNFLSGKLDDVAVLYNAFLEYISKKYTTTEELMDRVSSLLPLNDNISRRVIAFDGFTGFTPVQLKLIEALMMYAKDVYATILTDEVEKFGKISTDTVNSESSDTSGDTASSADHELFHLSHKTIIQLRNLAKKVGVQEEQPVCLRENRRLLYSTRLYSTQSCSKPTMMSETTQSLSSDSQADNEQAQESDARIGSVLRESKLAYLERHLFRDGHFAPFSTLKSTDESTGKTIDGDQNDPDGHSALNESVNGDVLDEEIAIRAASDVEDEIEYVTEIIQRLISEKNYQYRDLAIVTGDIEGYRSTIERVLGRHGIPYFVDKTQPVLLNPFIEYIRALLSIEMEDYSFESVFRLLKSSLFDIESDKLDRLENYVLARGIRGSKQWHDRFVNISRDEEAENLLELEQIRESVVNLIDRFDTLIYADKLSGESAEPTVLDVSKALYGIITSENVHRKLYAMADKFEEQGDGHLATEYRQLYEAVMHLLESMCSLLGDEKITLREYSDLLEAGLDELRIGIVPRHSDYVQICDLTRSRISSVKTLFVVGANDGIIPSGVSGGGLLTDMEREFLLRGDEELSLAPTAREQAYTQRLYIYMMLTKPSEHLIVTYHMISSGGPAFPSYLIGTLEDMFGESGRVIWRKPRTLWEHISDRQTAPNLIASNLTDYIAGRLNEEDMEAYRVLLKCAANNPQLHEAIDSIIKSELMKLPLDADDPNLGDISSAVAKALYGRKIMGSVTRLEMYADCAYRYFLSYGLNLKERELYTFEMKDMGTLLHAALEQYSKKMLEMGYTFSDIPADEMEALMDDAVDSAVAASGMAVLYSNSRYAYAVKRAKRIMRRTAEVLTYQVNRGKFAPKYFEVDFDRISDIKSINVQLSDDEYMKLRGRIDRVDVCEENDEIYVKIIDYKSGNKSLDLEAVYQGRQLQLLVYLGTAMEMIREEYHRSKNTSTVHPAGIFYYHIDDPVIDMPNAGASEEDIRNSIYEKLKLSGLINSDRNVIDMFDSDISGSSPVIPVSFNKDGSLRKGGSALSEDDINALIEGVNAKIKELGQNILAGKIDTALEKAFADGISREKCKSDHCTYCEFESICENKLGSMKQ